MTAPDAMPEREMWWLNPEEDGTMIVVDHPVASFPLAIRLVPESRLREVEAERDVMRTSALAARDAAYKAEHTVSALRAERDALVPLARYALPVWESGGWGAAARAILDRLDREAK